MVTAMCGRACRSDDISEIKVAFRIPPERPAPNFAATGWNVAPTNPLPVVRYDSRSITAASITLSTLSCFGMALCDSLLPARAFRAAAGIAMAGMYMPGLGTG
jgi:hypothetical protein